MSQNGDGPVVQVDEMTIRYGKMTAVDGLTFEVPAGCVYALLGRNGAGKSSLVRCILGMQKPERGSVRLFGGDVWTQRASLMQRVGMVPEDPDAPPEMTADEILDFCSRLYKKWNRRAADERLDRFGVQRKTPFGRLSKGQKREVLLSISLASEPELLVLDDPTLGLDVVARKELFEELVVDLADRGTTVFVTTHDLPGIEAIADRVGIMKDGRLVLDEDVEALKWRHRRLRYATLATAADDQPLGRLEAIGMRRWGAGVEAVVSNYDDLTLESFRAESGVNDVEVTPMSLEEIFIAIAGEGQSTPDAR